MSKISNAAKAASLLHHTWGVETIDEAVRLYDLIASNTTMHIVDILDKNRVGVWDAIDQLSQEAWWENVEMLALSIDATRDYFERKEKDVEQRFIDDWNAGKVRRVHDGAKPWVGLTIKDKEDFLLQDFGGNRLDAMDWAARRLKEKNT